MQDDEFFDLLYQQWTKTTRAEDAYWMVEEVDVSPEGQSCLWWDVVAVDKDDNRTRIASFDYEVDADFVAGLHGCLGDLIRRLHQAVEEAESSDKRADEAVQDQFKLACELAELEKKHQDERGYSAYLQCDIDDLKAELAQVRAERDTANSKNYERKPR